MNADALIYLSGGSHVAILSLQSDVLEVQMVPWLRRCVRLTASEGDQLLRRARHLGAGLGASTPASTIGAEMISLTLRDEGARGIAVPADVLEADPSATLVEILCTAEARLPKITRRAVAETIPTLGARLGFPFECRHDPPSAE